MASPRSNPKLKKLYLRYSRRYFSSLLPTDMIVCYADGRHDEEYAANRKRRKYGAWHYKEAPRQVITINKWFRKHRLWNEIYTTLLHECIHVYLGPRFNHGLGFKAEVRRLAKLGALDDLV